MSSQLLLLKPNVIAEPRVCGWYASYNFIAPLSAPYYLGHQLSLLRSYIRQPQAHLAALKNPELVGGPFVATPLDQLQDLIAFEKKATQDLKGLLDFAEDIDKFRTMLSSFKGFDLADAYRQIPESLKGYIELFYDLSNNPDFRVFEALTYNSPGYKDSLQSVWLHAGKVDSREFVVNTPRFPGDGAVEVRMPFAWHGYDAIFASRTTAMDREALSKLCLEAQLPLETLLPFFDVVDSATSPERTSTASASDSIDVKYYGHACIGVGAANLNFLSDPLVAYGGVESSVPKFTLNDLPKQIDYLLITHAHQDHLSLETLLQIRHRTKNVLVPRASGTLADPSLKLILEKCGFKNVIEMSEFDSISFAKGKIIAIPFLGEHGDLNIRSKTSFALEFGNERILLAADSHNIDPKLYNHIQKIYGDFQTVFVGMECVGAPLSWAYRPYFQKALPWDQDQSRRLKGSNASEVSNMVESLNAKRVFVYAMGREPWTSQIMNVAAATGNESIDEAEKLVAWCKKKGVDASLPFGQMHFVIEQN